MNLPDFETFAMKTCVKAEKCSFFLKCDGFLKKVGKNLSNILDKSQESAII
jgi:hypothetical protein